ncbi:hypothetical protein EXIGLDRAFT_314983 [Exidia glandulosa HHB12029]|uniref:Uncharacterized protein n=1 Tax=Exidia glandulosa HHB12029 TaxID=1314781 RepID=A0A165CY76_EXIGL|nr:hypothetical protein EXIGLDRAFT_314983 [Exidia glandulosa HHB12029]
MSPSWVCSACALSIIGQVVSGTRVRFLAAFLRRGDLSWILRMRTISPSLAFGRLGWRDALASTTPASARVR